MFMKLIESEWTNIWGMKNKTNGHLEHNSVLYKINNSLNTSISAYKEIMGTGHVLPP